MDPYVHHPELRGRLRPAADSFFRDLDLAAMDARMAEMGRGADWRQPCAQREAGRRAFLAARPAGPLWVFAYGSLMWDPAMEFAEVRRAHTPSHARHFCLWDDGGRGSADHPALQLALDSGAGCDGLAFRIDDAAVERETFVLFRREMIAYAYRPVWLTLGTDHGPITALGFQANPESDRIRRDFTPDAQARMIAAAEGILGTNRAYLFDTASQLAALGIEDAMVSDLCARVRALSSDRAG